MNTATIDWIPYLRWVRRRPLLIVIPAIAAVALGAAASRFIPPSFRARTLILVEPSQVAAEYVKPTVQGDLRDRLGTIEQQITNRETLTGIIEDVGLYPEMVANGNTEMAAAIASSRLQIRVQRRQVFEVAFVDEDPKLAAATANRVAEVFLEQNMLLREKLLEGTTSFLEVELTETRERLEKQDALIAAFKTEHLGELPEQRGTLLGAIEGAQRLLEGNMLAADKALSRKLTLEKELQQLRPAGSSPSQPASSAAGSDQFQRLQELQAELATLRSRFTDKHPDVVRLEREIAALSEALGAEPATNALPQLSAYELSVRDQLRTVETQLRELEIERAMLLRQIEADQYTLRYIPRVESELTSLTRDYNNIENAYRSLLDKRLQAGLAQNLEKKQQGEQFRILERAIPPRQPYSPDIPMILMASLAAGTAAGAGLAFLKFQADQTIPDRDTLEAYLSGLEILGSVPLLELQGSAEVPTGDRPSRRKRRFSTVAKPPSPKQDPGGSWASVVRASHQFEDRSAVGGTARGKTLPTHDGWHSAPLDTSGSSGEGDADD